MTKMQFTAWPVDEGDLGIRLDIDRGTRASLPPCPGLGGWKEEGPGSWWTRLKGAAAVELAAALESTPDGWFQDVTVTMDGTRLVSAVPAGGAA